MNIILEQIDNKTIQEKIEKSLYDLNNIIRREKYIFNIYISLLLRDFNKYKKKFIYFASYLGIYPSIKPAYFFCRAIDDFADGDSPLPIEVNNFEELVNKLYDTIDNEDINKNDLSDLELVLIDMIEKIEKVAISGDNISLDIKIFLKSMLFEYKRRISFKTFSQDELNNIYDDTFSSVINLALIGSQSKNRVSDLRYLGRVQGKIKAIKDFEHEIPLGIINIPEEIISKSSLTLEQIIKKPKIIFDDEIIKKWIISELKEGKNIISNLRKLKLDDKANKIIEFSVNSLESFIDKKFKTI